MNEQDFGRRLRALLDERLALRPEVATRLHVAREKALGRQRAPHWEFVPAWAGRIFGPLSPWGGAIRYLMPALLVAMALLAFQQFDRRLSGPGDDLAEIDAAVLKSELPIEAYLDSDFQSWLKRSAD